jgi:formylglycine-generating enzyme required for sulfatase activity
MPIKQAPIRNLLGLIASAFCLAWIPVHAQDVELGKVSKATKTAHLPKAGRVLRDCPFCPEMVIIPAGSFEMGSPSSEDGRGDDEGPVHRVKVSGFALGKNEITWKQFAAFVKHSKYIAADKCWTLTSGKFEERSERNWRDLGFLQDDKHPVACINWYDAQAYAKWLSRKTGKHYRLPSEAEWEYAARAGTVTSRFWGDNPDDACKYANAADKSSKTCVGALSWSAHNCTDGYAFTSPVGKFKPNKFGLYDMLGNLWEWTEDNYHDSYLGAPNDGSAWQGIDTKRILRGGSWNNGPTRVRSAKRGRDKPAIRFSNIGFRVARTLP